jgi:hypothetical protein
LIPLVLQVEAETLGTALDNLGRAERFGWLPSSADWTLENFEEFKLAQERGKQLVPFLLNTEDNILLLLQGKQYIRLTP